MKVLILGDIVGTPGMKIAVKYIQQLRSELAIDFVVVNGENIVSSGRGFTKETVAELLANGVDCITLGNHTWDRFEAGDLLAKNNRLLRPLNYPIGTKGKGYNIFTAKNGEKICVINVLGRYFMEPLRCPFKTVEELLPEIHTITRNILIDIHAEATSEKQAFAWFMDGKVSCVYGTHTHIQTNDDRLLPKGTAYITDVGMTGPRDSVIGTKVDVALRKFLTQMPIRMEVAEGPMELNAIVLELEQGKASSITKIRRNWEA